MRDLEYTVCIKIFPHYSRRLRKHGIQEKKFINKSLNQLRQVKILEKMHS